MNIYDQIAANDRRTIFILCAFPVTLFVTVYLFAVLYSMLVGAGYEFDYAMQITGAFYPLMVLLISIWIAFSFYNGDSMILKKLHARRVTLEENRELFRLVENTAIMAGIPAPGIYIIEDDSLNAFATGRNPGKASIVLTKGIVEKLDKAELQAVIAHELAHIGSHDSLLMLITITGIGCVLFIGQILFYGSFMAVKKGNKFAAFSLLTGVICLVFGYMVAPFLRFALSRRREYQADATAVKITRDPHALARALAKIAGNSKTEILAESALIGNMCIAKPVDYERIYCTHPSIKDRVVALGVDVSGLHIPDEVLPISPIQKRRVIIMWMIGVFGTIGLHYFALSRTFEGFFRFVYGFLIWGVLMLLVFDESMPRDTASLSLGIVLCVLLIGPSVYDIIQFRRGTFQDSKGAFLKR